VISLCASLYLAGVSHSQIAGGGGSAVPAAAVAIRPGEVIVEIREGASIDQVNARHNTITVRRIYGTNYYRLRIPLGQTEDTWRAQLEIDGDVLNASLNRIVTSPFSVMSGSIMSFPDGEAKLETGNSGYLQQRQTFEGHFQLPEAHLRSRGQGTVVAIIDTGIDWSHPVIASRIWQDDRANAEVPGDGIDDDHDGLIDDVRGWDLVNNDPNPTELPADPATTVAGHGTFIAGLINMLAPDAMLMPLRTFSEIGESDEFTVAEAIKYATDHGADVINMSFGSYDDSKVLRDAISYAGQQNVVLIAAMGNEGTNDHPQYPARLNDEVMGIAAIDLLGLKTYFSNYGNYASASAPGLHLVSLYPGGIYANWSGTSFSAPLASAEAALIAAATRDTRLVTGIIEATAVNIDSLNPDYAGELGSGRISPLNALKSVSTNNVIKPTADLIAVVKMAGTAKGSARISIAGPVQHFRIDCSGLKPHSTYRLVIDGYQLTAGSLTTDAFGGIAAVFSNVPLTDCALLPQALVPPTRIKQVTLRDSANTTVLSGQFAAVQNTAPANEFCYKEAQFLAPDLSQVGIARVAVDNTHEMLNITADRLVRDGYYRIMVDGTNLGLVLARSGFLTVSYSSSVQPSLSTPTGVQALVALPYSVRPAVNVTRVDILDLSGRLVARATFQLAGAVLGDAAQ
jgi:subtilisin family serine protease